VNSALGTASDGSPSAVMIRKVKEDEIVAALRAEIDAWIAERKAAEGATAAAH